VTVAPSGFVSPALDTSREQPIPIAAQGRVEASLWVTAIVLSAMGVGVGWGRLQFSDWFSACGGTEEVFSALFWRLPPLGCPVFKPETRFEQHGKRMN
jgi:hypothetical protein